MKLMGLSIIIFVKLYVETNQSQIIIRFFIVMYFFHFHINF